MVSDQEFKEIVPEEVKERLQRSTISPSKNRDSDMKGYPSTIEKGEDDEVEQYGNMLYESGEIANDYD